MREYHEHELDDHQHELLDPLGPARGVFVVGPLLSGMIASAIYGLYWLLTH